MKTDNNFKYTIGTKVVIVSKYGDVDNLNYSTVFKILLLRNQKFAFITNIKFAPQVKRICYVVSEDENVTGDYFDEIDLIPYVIFQRKKKLKKLQKISNK